MVNTTWYNPDEHKRYERVADFNDVHPMDIGGLLAAHEQRRRERAVKIAHLRYVEHELHQCYLYHTVHNFKQHCRHLIHEFNQTRNEVMGWKKDTPLVESLPNAHKHYDFPTYGDKPDPRTSSVA